MIKCFNFSLDGSHQSPPFFKNSSSVDQGAPNLWSRCCCWSRSSQRNVIVSDACDSHCHSVCNAGVNKRSDSQVRGHFCLFWSLRLKNGAESRQSVPSFLITCLQALWDNVVPGVTCSREERKVQCLFICQFSSFPPWSLWISIQALKETPKDRDLTLLKVFQPQERGREY